jgi:uncharacterized membrane protein
MNQFGTYMLAMVAGCLMTLLVITVLLMIFRRNGERKSIPHRAEMQRFMLLGLYCNPDDPRLVVRKPTGRGWTLNVRREELAVALQVGLLLSAVGVLLAIAFGMR